ncbi:hypothetical protein EDB19DRAFT_1859895, partial [Suillus lakei]
MNPDKQPPKDKRQRGRPKGSKNGPNAGTTGRPVGRPRKDGTLQMPKVNTLKASQQTVPSQSCSTETGSHLNSDGSGSKQPVAICSPGSSVSPALSGCTEQPLMNVNDVPTSADSNIGTLDPPDEESDIELVQVLPQLNTSSTSRDLENGTKSNPAQSASCKKSRCNPPKVLDEQLCDYNEDEDEDDILPGGIDADIDFMLDEFAAITDDDDTVCQDLDAAVVSNLPPEHAASAEGTKAKIPRATMPTWLADEYADARTRLDSEIAKMGRPACYENGQFTMTVPPLVFSRVVPYEIEPMDFYRPQFFIWLPHIFHRIPCPDCKDANRRTKRGQPVMLRILGWPQHPRRVVDLEHLVFIIGHWYYCGHEDCKKTFQSWSPAVMRVIPPPLAALFPFHLTYRCGLTDRVVGVLRGSFQRGIGPSPFAKYIRTMHIRYYEQLHVQYLETVRQRMQASSSGLLPSHRPFPRWNDPSGYAGYVPTHHYFRCFYNSLVELHAVEMDQHMAMQSAEGLSHDHSYKVTGLLGKVNGVATFGALHTACNDYGECRKMTLTPTKGHDDCMPALAEIPGTLAKYGHTPVKVVFTDNVRGDKSALERAFPSLLHDVNPIPSSTLEDLVVPDDWHVCRLGSTYQINCRMNCLMDELHALDAEKELHIAFDLEWPVDRETGIYGRISQYVQDNGFLKLPSSLLVVLRSKRVCKIGVQVKADLTRLYNDCGFSNSSNEQPFVGALELGSMAKDRNVTDRTRVSLADLTALVLQRNLPKDASVRISTKWDDPDLSPEQEQYAALDVFAAWAILESFLTIPSSGPVTSSTPVGTQVQLMSRNGGLVVAHGHIARHQPKQLDGVNVSKTRIIITLTSIVVPAYLIRAELRANRQEIPISSVGSQLPVPLLCNRKDLRT